MSSRSNRATRLHAIATEMGVDPELVGVLGKGLRNDDAIRDAVRKHLDEAKAREESKPAATAEPKPKKAGLTLSQRRALLRLLDAMDEGVSPASAFKSLPYEKLVDVGYADRTILDENSDDVTNDAGIGVYTLTDEGLDRAMSINPGYRVWASGETVVLDDEGNPVVIDPETGLPIRPPAGTHRTAKQAEAAAKAEAEAKAAAEQEQDAKASEADSATGDQESTDETEELVTA